MLTLCFTSFGTGWSTTMVRFFDFVIWFCHYLFRAEIPSKLPTAYQPSCFQFHEFFNLSRTFRLAKTETSYVVQRTVWIGANSVLADYT